MERGLPLFASTIAIPVLRREASMASMRIIGNLKITPPGFNTESTNSSATALLPANVERKAYTSDEQRVDQLPYDHRDYDRCSFHRAFIIRYDERFEPNRDTGFAAQGRSLAESANPGRADCEPV